jgi:DNA (cytosine-5)-methyltransferase 1
MVKPTVISTFAGCGGSSLGYQLAGFHELLAVEWDDNAVETFKLNFPDVPVYHGDITKLSGDECMRLAGVGKGELDVLDGSPPCQGFSTAGKRKFDDPRNSLFMEYARLLEELQPKAFVMENVTGMIKGYMKQAYLQIIKTLRGCGYKAKGQVLNAMYYNVPQSRERVIIIGVREDIGIEPSHPKPQSKPIPLKDVILNIKEDGTEVYYPIWLLKAVKEIKRRETQSQGTKKTAFKKYKGTTGGSHGFIRLSWMRPSATLCKSFGSVAFLGHPDDKRFLNLSECKRVASFPDKFEFIGDFRKQIIARIGNSVPPNLMKAIAEHIKENILVSPIIAKT